jgi:hypothetical protein
VRARAATVCVLALSCALLRAGEPEVSVNAPDPAPWSGAIAQGWDSLYMYRGVNQLPGFGGYGSSISWTALTLAWAPTEADTFSVDTWTAFGLGGADYKEFDVTAAYARSIGDLSLAAAYALYAVLSSPGGLYCHELSISAEYEFRWGPAVLTPSLEYAFTLGPSPEHGGYVQPGAGYFEARLDAVAPVIPGLVDFSPWIAAGLNFDYNSRDIGNGPEPFTGANHLEAGVSLPVTISARLSVVPYVAFSQAWQPLPGTKRSTFWGGAAVTFSF